MAIALAQGKNPVNGELLQKPDAGVVSGVHMKQEQMCMKPDWTKAFRIFALIASLTSAQPTFAQPSREAVVYLGQALQLIRQNHRNAQNSDWDNMVMAAEAEITDAKLPKDTYPAIRGVLAKLNEPHSIFIEPSSIPAFNNMQQDTDGGPLMPSWKLERQRFGVVTLPGLYTTGGDQQKKMADYASTLRDGLTSMDKSKICGWIVDLRQNGGGNMWPMLWGLDPLLGPPPFGFFTGSGGQKEHWVRANGSIYPTRENPAETPPAFQLKHGEAPVAVLVGPKTGSSGEMTAIAFIGRKNVRLFGSPTYGLTSANSSHPLSDGAILVLTGASVSDRLDHEYTGPIIPDERVADDKVKPTAMKWLKKQCG